MDHLRIVTFLFMLPWRRVCKMNGLGSDKQLWYSMYIN